MIGGVTETIGGPEALAREFYFQMDRLAEEMDILGIVEQMPRDGDYHRYVVTGQ